MQNAARNREIDARNAARQEAVRLLAAPDATLQAKMAGAAAAGRQRVITDRWGPVLSISKCVGRSVHERTMCRSRGVLSPR